MEGSYNTAANPYRSFASWTESLRLQTTTTTTHQSERKRKQNVQRPEKAERKLIEVWADILQRYSGAMIFPSTGQDYMCRFQKPQQAYGNDDLPSCQKFGFCENYQGCCQQQTQPGHCEALRRPRTGELYPPVRRHCEI